ncbi:MULTISPECIES: DNA-3-methyladenine glycosylase family protein [Providencia]|uniref:DNA-3-methyladenine glycosylase family protein n=1 Tax=Providencia TaxID=586 RepID=UPI0008FB2007|nr:MULTISPECIES: DNA-3-methyladenine glycosylase 2 [Providencia]APC09968.1 DNA-3-methyladenine glycosylase [Providencia rettgeri]AVL73618.1 DNA-3-methyladenine glycosylase 2 [Providencia rettgeri]EKH6497686.1 DNA-3-methyladenine glycosylase 2 [Providencia rettgeri]ELR5054343.1 DNA-3-methyladenine glycosylase 2 [Providencia rettgeri]ELR5156120.1 DNA-3-methyladenine glycosylase 2 [Providencia rettgeri]
MKTFLVKLPLPSHYLSSDFFAFHLRDQQNVAEIVEGNTLHKGLIWQQQAAKLNLMIKNQQATLSLEIDSPTVIPQESELHSLAKHLLGLNQPVEQFEAQYMTDPIIGKLIKKQQGLRIYQSANAFEALVWAIIGQQISVHAAIAIRRRFIQAVGLQHTSGIWCFPDVLQVSQVSDDTLRQAGFSIGKVVALRALCDAIENQQIDLSQQINHENVNFITEQLLQIKGIGPWTVSYALLRGFNYLNGSLHGDVAVRRNLQTLLTKQEPPTAKETEKWLTQFSPWRALVAAHLWRSQSAAGY